MNLLKLSLILTFITLTCSCQPNAIFALNKSMEIEYGTIYYFNILKFNKTSKFPLEIEKHATIKLSLEIYVDRSSAWKVYIKSKNGINITKVAPSSRFPKENIIKAHFLVKFDFDESMREIFTCNKNIFDYTSEFYIIDSSIDSVEKITPDMFEEKYFVFWRIVKNLREKIKTSLTDDLKIFDEECHSSLLFIFSILFFVANSLIALAIVLKYYI